MKTFWKTYFHLEINWNIIRCLLWLRLFFYILLYIKNITWIGESDVGSVKCQIDVINLLTFITYLIKQTICLEIHRLDWISTWKMKVLKYPCSLDFKWYAQDTHNVVQTIITVYYPE